VSDDFDLVAKLREAYRAQSKDAAYLMFSDMNELSEERQLQANLMYLAADEIERLRKQIGEPREGE
jgi:hypothetical protein